MPEAVITGNSSSVIYKNGNTIAIPLLNSGQTGPDGLAINGGIFSAEASDCQVSEILVYNSALLKADRQAVEAYFQSKYPGLAQTPPR